MKNVSILLVDDEISFLRSLRRLLWQEDYKNITIEENSTKVEKLLNEKEFDLIILDVSMPNVSGLSLLELITQTYPGTPVIMLTAIDNIETALQATKMGAYDYITKPPDTDRLLLTIKRALEQRLLEREIDSLRKPAEEKAPVREDFSDIITASPAMNKVFDLVEIFAPTNETILITGETGTGKDLIAEKIHKLSSRNEKPFVVVNLASISSNLFESELFGHEKGAFTGAASEKVGYFEAANEGTIFLDEIGELPKELQGKLLRTIQYGEIYRIGNSKPIKLNIRIIAATNKELLKAVNEKEFRADLYYRLNRGYIKLPPLRERNDDSILLADYFLRKGNTTYKKTVKGFSENILTSLKKYDWPGNIRELENVILNSVAKTEDGKIITEIDIPNVTEEENNIIKRKLTTIDEAVKDHITYVLNYTDGNIQKAAIILGVSERTLQRRLQQFRQN